MQGYERNVSMEVIRGLKYNFLPTLMYGSETWTWNRAQQSSVCVCVCVCVCQKGAYGVDNMESSVRSMKECMTYMNWELVQME